jgi:hypothetical protein
MKIALYRPTGRSDYTIVLESSDFRDDARDDYIRVSEVVDVDFPERSHDEVVAQELSSIDNQIKTVQVAAEVKLNELKQRRDELLALEYQS